MTKRHLFLVADVGGTNTRVGLADENGLIDGSTTRYKNAEVASFEAAIAAFLDEAKPGDLAGACVGAAGLVVDGVARMTNLDWQIDRSGFAQVTGAPKVDVINDLQAQGFALNALPEQSLKPLCGPSKARDGMRLVIGLGTGFNIVPVHQDRERLIVPSCEAGHMTAPYRPDLADLYAKVGEICGSVRVEWLLAGQGLQNIYQAHTGARPAAGDIMDQVAAGDATASAVMRDYVSVLATVTKDLAIAHVPYGGIYFTGGVSRAVTPYLGAYDFHAQMTDLDGFEDLLKGFPVTLIEDDFAALKGCARYLRQLSA
ncbi:ROK family protein [Cognatishimia sp.]|uniref:glucokinase n=1 Tax=Cognatishimia sp. TaxID=2211648 RepID=UPI003511AA08